MVTWNAILVPLAAAIAGAILTFVVPNIYNRWFSGVKATIRYNEYLDVAGHKPEYINHAILSARELNALVGEIRSSISEVGKYEEQINEAHSKLAQSLRAIDFSLSNWGRVLSLIH